MHKSSKIDEIKIRVRYAETDKMGFVYHGNYAQYFEVGRVEWLRKFDVSYKQMEDDGIMLPVISLNVNFKRSVYYDDVIKVKTELVKMPTATIEFNYEITNETDDILATGNTVLVFMDIKRNRPIRCPQYLLDKLKD